MGVLFFRPKMAKVTLSVHKSKSEQEDKIGGPLLASFRGGLPAEAIESCDVFQRTKKSKIHRILAMQTDKMMYQGSSFDGVGTSMNKYLVGIYDPVSRKVKLHVVSNMYAMKQAIKSYVPQVEGYTQDMDYANKRMALVEAFGNKISKRISKAYNENRVDTENIAGASTITKQLQTKVDEKKHMVKTDAVTLAMEKSRMEQIPPYDVDAQSPVGVYTLSAFITSDVYECLDVHVSDYLTEVSDASPRAYIAQYNIQGFIALCLLKQDLSAPALAKKHLRHIFYTHYLLWFFNYKFPLRSSPEQVAEEHNIPVILLEHFLQLFAECHQKPNGQTRYVVLLFLYNYIDISSYVRSKQLKDKCLFYALVMALHLSSFSLDLNEICADFKLSSLLYVAHYILFTWSNMYTIA